MASKSTKKPAPTSSDGGDARRWREDNGTPRPHLDAHVAELFPNESHNEVLPVQRREALYFAQAHDPLAPVPVLRVLPRRRNTLSEEVVISYVTFTGERVGLDEVVVDAEEAFHAVEGAYFLYCILIALRVRLLLAPISP